MLEYPTFPLQQRRIEYKVSLQQTVDMNRRRFEPRNLNQVSFNMKMCSRVLKPLPGETLNPTQSIQPCSEEHSELKYKSLKNTIFEDNLYNQNVENFIPINSKTILNKKGLNLFLLHHTISTYIKFKQLSIILIFIFISR